MGGAGLAGAALLGSAACGGGGSSGELILSWGPDETGGLPKLIEQFNKQSKDFKVKYQQMFATAASISGVQAATSSTPKIHPRSSLTAPNPRRVWP
jgi:ABC-type glycerol-3-phosphate transport system substrate-binding protein